MNENAPTADAALKLLVLVPHRDARILLRPWSKALFASGCEGAWSFPWVAPLALLSRPLTAEELKHCARVLREASMAGGKDGTFKTGAVSRAPLGREASGAASDDAVIFGLLLNFAIPGDAFTIKTAEKIIRRFSPPVLGTQIIINNPLHTFACEASGGKFTPEQTGGLPSPSALSFRAAAVANMRFRISRAGNSPDSLLFEWTIGKCCWLPSPASL